MTAIIASVLRGKSLLGFAAPLTNAVEEEESDSNVVSRALLAAPGHPRGTGLTENQYVVESNDPNCDDTVISLSSRANQPLRTMPASKPVLTVTTVRARITVAVVARSVLILARSPCGGAQDETRASSNPQRRARVGLRDAHAVKRARRPATGGRGTRDARACERSPGLIGSR